MFSVTSISNRYIPVSQWQPQRQMLSIPMINNSLFKINRHVAKYKPDWKNMVFIFKKTPKNKTKYMFCVCHGIFIML